jgi:hypothetical protein
VARNGRALRLASAELQADREVVVAAVTHHGFALMHASAELQGEVAVVLAAWRPGGHLEVEVRAAT